MKIFKEIFLNITDKYRTLITWTLVFVFFLFSLIHALIITGAMAGVSFVETKILVRNLLQKRKRMMFYLVNIVFISAISAFFLLFQFKVADVMRAVLPVVPPVDNT